MRSRHAPIAKPAMAKAPARVPVSKSATEMCGGRRAGRVEEVQMKMSLSTDCSTPSSVHSLQVGREGGAWVEAFMNECFDDVLHGYLVQDPCAVG